MWRFTWRLPYAACRSCCGHDEEGKWQRAPKDFGSVLLYQAGMNGVKSRVYVVTSLFGALTLGNFFSGRRACKIPQASSFWANFIGGKNLRAKKERKEKRCAMGVGKYKKSN